MISELEESTLEESTEESTECFQAQPSAYFPENTVTEAKPLEAAGEQREAPSQSPTPLKQPSRRSEMEIFLSTFFTIFVAELGDKTQVTTLLMSAESQAPWVVFLGAGLALVATSLLGVLLGRWLASRVSPKVLETVTGAILLLVSVLLLWDVISV
jgi:putative Ca2+/H+ antiporter (TMEM165/GDT1 family)